MKPIRVNISCNRNDLYFLRICVASIRYWNRDVPIYLLKDHSKGDFDTSPLERAFGVQVENTRYKSQEAFMKLQPFIEQVNQRIFLQDADVVWLGDLANCLEKHTEQVVLHAYVPENRETELDKRYFKLKNLTKIYPYQYPGFVFNTGAMLFDTGFASADEFLEIIEWKEMPKPYEPDIFQCEDQGIINYVVGKNILQKQITYAFVDLQWWGFSKEAAQYPVANIKDRKGICKVIHWYGEKHGFISLLPGSKILQFYEEFYYSHFPDGPNLRRKEKISGTLPRLHLYLFEYLKKLVYRFTGKKQYEESL